MSKYKLSIVNCQLSIISFVLLLSACNRVSIPSDFTQVDSLPKIYPDYIDVTIPVNIADINEATIIEISK